MQHEPNHWGELIFAGPFDRQVWYPSDRDTAIRLEFDDEAYSIEYYTVKYGEVYRYRGRKLPTSAGQWALCRYLPPTELEVAIVKMAAGGVRFRDIVRRVNRPRYEVAAILNQHEYPGLQYARHGDLD